MKLNYPSADRNKESILNVLKSEIQADKDGVVLEISSGTGQHITHFASYFQNWTWQPSEINSDCLVSISKYVEDAQLTNVLPPVFVDVMRKYETWNGGSLKRDSFDLIVCINAIHITPLEFTTNLFNGAGALLKSGGKLITYGPYQVDGVLTPQSNVDFNESLKQRNPLWGIRDTEFLRNLANENMMSLEKMVDTPANNKCLVFLRK